MTTTVRPVIFPNREGAGLFGMLHLPANRRTRDAGIIILSPGVKSRIAPHRLYVKMSERFVDLGFPVFRFDYHGLGDSEGTVNERFLADLYGSIQKGRFVDDALASMDWMERELGVRRFIVGGLCGGAITGLLAAASDCRVASVFGLGIPVILDGTNIDYFDHSSDGQMTSLRRKYLEKMFDPGSWLRLLTFRSDFRLLFKSLFRPLAGVFRRRNDEGVAEEGLAGADGERDRVEGNFNGLFPPSFFSVVSSKRRILLVFSEKDRLYWEFEEKFHQRYRSRIEAHRDHLDVHVTKDANHIFSFPEWQADMMTKLCSWVAANHPVDGPESEPGTGKA